MNLDNAYDNAMRNIVPNELYNADSANLHLLGSGMDNLTADAAYEACRAAEYSALAAEIGI